MHRTPKEWLYVHQPHQGQTSRRVTKTHQVRQLLADIASKYCAEGVLRAEDHQENTHKPFINKWEEWSDSTIYIVYVDVEPEI